MNSPCIDEYGTRYWYNEGGQIHRDNDLPAVIHADGDQYWYKHGQLHCDNDLPAIVRPNGTLIWYKHGQIHRDNDLPVSGVSPTNSRQTAVIYADGEYRWFQNGVEYTPVMCKI